MEAHVHGVSTRKVDDLVKALGADTGIFKSEVSRICSDLMVMLKFFGHRDLPDTAFPRVFPDATYCKAQITGASKTTLRVICAGTQERRLFST